MNERRARFVREYAKDGNGTKAAVRAGYTEQTAATTASRLLRNAEIQDALVAQRKRVEAVAVVDRAWVLRALVRAAERTERERDWTAHVAALRLIAQHRDVDALVSRHTHDIQRPLLVRVNYKQGTITEVHHGGEAE